MSIRSFLTPEDLQIMLDETYGNQQTQDFIRPNPLQFQYPYIPGGIMNTGSVMYDEFPAGFNFTPQAPSQKFEFLPEAYNQSEDIEQVKSSTETGSSGIAKLFEFLGNIPTPFNLVRRGLESLSGLNQRLRATDFGQSKTMQEYLQRREARKDAERLQTVGQQLQQASERGGGYRETSEKENIARTESRRADKGLGRGGVYGL